jgi:hypothetical protein
MSFKTFRDRAAQSALACAVILVIVDSLCRVSFWHVNREGRGETTTPPGVVRAWLLLLSATVLLGLITLPRWQSFLTLVCAGWVVLMTLQGHWPGL